MGAATAASEPAGRATAPAADGGWVRRHVDRLTGGPGRVPGVDVARGIAVLGMFTAHVGVTSGDPGTLEGWLSLAHGRSSILFALVAGVSIAIVSGGERPLDGAALVRARTRLLVRAVLLMALVALLDLLGTRVALILGFYAAYFVLALPFLRWRPPRLAALAVVVAAVGPVLAHWGPEVLARAGLRLPHDGSGAATDFLLTGHYPAVVWMAYVLAGMAIGRCGLGSRGLRKGLVLGGLTATAVGGVLSEWLVARAGGVTAIEDRVTMTSSALVPEPYAWSDAWPTSSYLLLSGPHHDTTFEAVASGGFAVAVLGLCLYAGAVGRWVLAPLAAAGSMALTVYSLQIVAIWRWDLVGSATNGPLALMVVVTLVAATAWRFLVGRGPLERLLAWTADGAARRVTPSRGSRT
ncbi:heparan-alpha-glucosaminide N-acetyltransferase domain-containing protein [Isoptericola sp. NEAU-Y5]|uniref:Heparan-alpha-glucosaminide N-acetyltransferase domain-containing protein n=1 Tax=Isoptericola luteus TaxID=2879484 RepID=A0ABS7ZIH7_9MICO|nr:heparan-alpha-glucosaminide N-acetyltransferase domain-containing protein [Isoptericola sp. NEAU-Y5]MCA5894818.1 heparan-alpha-glucosaminide N-acetyltransferase domain-containing protein [Isoptericola sp. NEAU-Y5]